MSWLGWSQAAAEVGPWGRGQVFREHTEGAMPLHSPNVGVPQLLSLLALEPSLETL